MSGFALEAVSERRLIIEQVAARRGILPVIVEKDFWVCWILGRIFECPAMAPGVVFKGGTSLSKVFGVIHRFSEDADLSVSPTFLGFTEADLDEAPSSTARPKRMKALGKACEECVAQRFQPALEAAVAEILGPAVPPVPWLRFEIDSVAGTPNLWFNYPSVLPQAGGYIAKQVKLELGSLTSQQPTGHHVIQPMLADVLGEAFPDFRVAVVALELERSFWEKATILHAEYHRPADQTIRDRVARHYSDVAALWHHPSHTKALARMDVLHDVIRHKSRFFASGWASYGTAVPGTFHLVPAEHRHEELARDLEAMRPMFLTEAPTFTVLLKQLELRGMPQINGRASWNFPRTGTCCTRRTHNGWWMQRSWFPSRGGPGGTLQGFPQTMNHLELAFGHCLPDVSNPLGQLRILVGGGDEPETRRVQVVRKDAPSRHGEGQQCCRVESQTLAGMAAGGDLQRGEPPLPHA